jgi:hypothetical protein
MAPKIPHMSDELTKIGVKRESEPDILFNEQAFMV